MSNYKLVYDYVSDKLSLTHEKLVNSFTLYSVISVGGTTEMYDLGHEF